MSKLKTHINFDLLNNLSDNTFQLKKRGYLYRKADASTCIMLIHSGSLKTVYSFEGTKEHRVDDFHIKNDIIGLDAMMDSYYSTDAIALEDSIIKAVSYEKFSLCASRSPEVVEMLDTLKARFMARKEETRRILNNLRAESRMAAFFISIISRMASIGYSNQEIQLKMTNKDIANFLGVKGETISRAKKSLVKTGAILWDKKNFKILNLEILNKIISPKTSPNLMFGF